MKVEPDDFEKERERLNRLVLSYAGKNIKRFFALDSSVYREGALDRKTKELLGLVASLTLRCDDCVRYHLSQCRELGITDEELEEAMAVALVVGGSIVIPHLRRAFEFWTLLEEGE
ncbi:alkylhydroperoxidase [Thermoplasmatales archaeon ex4484_36]|nr:MAG: alkylhydroperoxidase [Thermoplasmatales archaeon ex4484_36]RLF55706.1 MAG: carboxymuconolactone decarboxylase family protein [Thermoplasmata archaeon]RLF71352.1 MAG: carboxymuconolactone decarboxylase family protein [Thermoplasmata archaeon]